MARTMKRKVRRILNEYDWHKWVPLVKVYIVSKNNKQGLLNQNGKKICGLKYYIFTTFDNDGTMPVCKNGQLIRLNAKGEELPYYECEEKRESKKGFIETLKSWFS